MDPRLIFSAFVTIFIAELGDKTQLATMGLAGSAEGGSSAKWAVFIGASLALIATTGIGVLVGDGLTRVIPEHWIQRGAGVLFIGIGAFYLWESAGKGG